MGAKEVIKYIILIIVFFPTIILCQEDNTDYCDSTLWEHVYKTKRFNVIEYCYSVTGTIEELRKEKDGDYHILLQLDEGLDTLLNEKNNKWQKGCLVLEIICVLKITQESVGESCDNYQNSVYIPIRGEHVKVYGSYVLDKQHGWMEIHPVMKIEVIE